MGEGLSLSGNALNIDRNNSLIGKNNLVTDSLELSSSMRSIKLRVMEKVLDLMCHEKVFNVIFFQSWRDRPS